LQGRSGTRCPSEMGGDFFWKIRIVVERANGLRAFQSELGALLRGQNRSLESNQRVEGSLKPEMHISFENHRFLIRQILAMKTMILGLKTPISGMFIDRYQNDN
jgi:hypothetical protein